MTAAILAGALTLAALAAWGILSLYDRHADRRKRRQARRERVLGERAKRTEADDAYRQALAGAQRLPSLPSRRA